jgi:hypothetical protein
MFLNFIALLTAISISSVAAYYSIYGLTAIFSGVFWPIVIMGGVLEVGKIVTTVWLHTYWHSLKFFLKLYMSVAVVVLMFITSMGIFGFLSRAHIEVTSQAGNGDLLIKQVDLGIAAEQKQIEDARAVITQMDNAVTGLLTGGASNATRDNNRTAQLTQQASKLREQQKKERETLTKSIAESNKRIVDLNKEKLRLQQEDLKIQAEVGPIKYIAQLIYDDELPGQSILEKAVRWVIIIIVAVFDPLAVCMVLGVTMVINRRREEQAELQAITEAQTEANTIIKEVERIVEVPVDRIVEVEVPIETIREVIKEVEVPVEVIREVEVPIEVIREIEIVKEIEVPVEVIRTVEVKVEDTAKLAELESEIKSLLEELESKDKQLAERVAIEEDTIDSPAETQTSTASILPDLEAALAVRADRDGPDIKVHFGTDFPLSPSLGELFLRLDINPSILYKYNGRKWIQVDKNRNDSYAFDEEVIAMTIDRLERGLLDYDELTNSEQAGIAPYYKKKS